MKPKFLAPPDELDAVLDVGVVTPRRKKKVKLKLLRREHLASPHILNLKNQPNPLPKEKILAEPDESQTKKQPFSITSQPVSSHFQSEHSSPNKFKGLAEATANGINLDAEKVIRRLHFWYGRWKTTLAFLGLGLLFIFGLRAVNWLAEIKREDYLVAAQGREGINLLKQGAQILLTDPNKAAAKFQSSLRQFLWAKEDLKRFRSWHLNLLGKNKIDAALALARSLKEITVAMKILGVASPDGLIAKIIEARPHLVAARHYVDEATRLLGPSAEIVAWRNLVSEQLLLIDDAAVLLGRDQWKRYLLLFQNDTEMRATGGFIGSFAVVDIDRGKIKNMEIPKGGSYDLQGQLTAIGAPPRALQLVKSRWEFQDANWFPDFPTSAEKIAWFYENVGGRTVDGVIALNTNLMIDFLKITGPVPMPAYQRVIDSDNFLLETQKIVELEYDKKANTPKAFIGDLAKEVIAKLSALPRERYGDILQVVWRNLENKNISLYAADPKIEQHIKNLGLAGAMHQSGPAEDYLSVIHTNIAGQKTDQVIKENVNYESNIALDGATTVTLTINRTHEGKKGELFRGVRNVDFARVYVPAGATLISATGFEQPPANLFKDPTRDSVDQKNVVAEENAFAIDQKSQTLIYNQFGKTVFANWLQVDPGKTATAVLVYTLPFKITDQYALYVEKQSGLRPIDFRLKLKYRKYPIQMAKNEPANEPEEIVRQFKLEKDEKIEIDLK